MDHLAIMKKSWGLTEKILSGEKTIESRWYKARCAPWNKIKSGETVYFKNSGEPVTLKAKVDKVLQFDKLTQRKVRSILNRYGKEDGIEKNKVKYFFDLFRNKNYCILVFLKNPQQVKPFSIDKTGFGSMSAWITLKCIDQVKKVSGL